MIEAIDSKSEENYISLVGKYTKLTPFDKVKNQLIAKIKEVYVPDESKVAGVINKLSALNFTGDDDEGKPKKQKKQQ